MESHEFPGREEHGVAVEAAPRLCDVPKASRGFRSGPLAAAVATVVILAATALPGPIRPVPAPVAPSPVLRTLAPVTMPSLMEVGTLSLGGSLAGFALDATGDAPVWLEREDGTASLSVKLVSVQDPDTFLEGVLEFRARISVEELSQSSRELFAANAAGFPMMPPMLRKVGADSDHEAYGSMAGTLVGGGALEGTAVGIRNIPGSAVRRGPWSSALDGRMVSFSDTVFARLVWLREAGGGAMEIADAGQGNLGLCLVSQ
ncbi:MAG: hypothetical protein ACJAQ3_001774 [Planctomycetota bacterium]|jgi:hypothetical protein